MFDWVSAVALGLIGSALLYLIKAVNRLSGRIGQVENEVVSRVGEMLEKEKAESILSHRRHNITDRIVSKFTERDYDTRQIVEGSQIPDAHPAIRKLLVENDKAH